VQRLPRLNAPIELNIDSVPKQRQATVYLLKLLGLLGVHISLSDRRVPSTPPSSSSRSRTRSSLSTAA
jgi:hypothetical protein